MPVLLRPTAGVAALLVTLASAASDGLCKEGSGAVGGMCKELSEEQAPGVELLQKRAERAPSLAGNAGLAAAEDTNASGPAAAAISLAASKAAANATSNASDNASAQSFPSSLKNLVPSGLSDTLSDAALRGFVNGLNATLMELDEEADEFLDRASRYRNELLQKAESGGAGAIEVVQDLVLANTDPIAFNLGQIVETIDTAVPAITQVVAALGFRGLATSHLVNVNLVRKAAQTVLDLMHRAQRDVMVLANTTDEELEGKLVLLNITAQAGLDAIKDLQESLVSTLEGLIDSVAGRLGIEMPSAETKATKEGVLLAVLDDEVESLLDKLKGGIVRIFTGTSDAATIAIQTHRKNSRSGATGVRWSAAVLLAALALGMS